MEKAEKVEATETLGEICNKELNDETFHGCFKAEKELRRYMSLFGSISSNERNGKENVT